MEGNSTDIKERTAGAAKQLRAKQGSFLFPAVLGGHFIGGHLHLKVERERKDATVSTVEAASSVELPVTSTTFI